MQEQLVKYLKIALSYIVKYSTALILIIIVGVTLLAVNKINQATNVERNETSYNKLLGEVKAIKFDDETIEDIRSLKAGGPTIDSNFPSGRNNPF